MAVYIPTCKAVVIDTESYAGNFEREMCAYLTGRTGECGVGSEVAAEARGQIENFLWWSQHVKLEADDRGCRRPVSIWPTPGWFNNGMGGHFRDAHENYDIAVEAAVASSIMSCAHQEQVLRKRLAEQDFEESDNGRGWTEEACLRQLEANAASHAHIRESRTRYPSYQSVAIFVDSPPDAAVLAEMKERAYTYARDRFRISKFKFDKDPINVTGFRFVEPKTVFEERAI